MRRDLINFHRNLVHNLQNIIMLMNKKKIKSFQTTAFFHDIVSLNKVIKI